MEIKEGHSLEEENPWEGRYKREYINGKSLVGCFKGLFLVEISFWTIRPMTKVLIHDMMEQDRESVMRHNIIGLWQGEGESSDDAKYHISVYRP